MNASDPKGMAHWPIIFALARAALGTRNIACEQHVDRLAEALTGAEEGAMLRELIATRPKPGDPPPARVVASSDGLMDPGHTPGADGSQKPNDAPQFDAPKLADPTRC